MAKLTAYQCKFIKAHIPLITLRKCTIDMPKFKKCRKLQAIHIKNLKFDITTTSFTVLPIGPMYI